MGGTVILLYGSAAVGRRGGVGLLPSISIGSEFMNPCITIFCSNTGSDKVQDLALAARVIKPGLSPFITRFT